MSRIVEWIVNIQMYHYVTKQNILSSSQSGFQKRSSSTTLLLNVTNNGLAIALILLDFSKAFDTSDHALFLSKLEY